MRGLRTATTTAACLAAFAAAAVPAGAATRAPVPRLAKVGNPPATLAAGSAFTMRFRAVNSSRRTSARATVTVRLAAEGRRIALPGKAIIPALKGRRSYRGTRRYVLPAAIAPGSYRLIACVKRRGVPAVCKTAARAFVVPGASQPGPTTEQPPATGADPPAQAPPPDEPPPPPDTTAPAVAITSPTEAADLGGRKPLIEGTAGTASGDVREVTVRFTGPGTLTLSGIVTSGGTWSVRPSSDLAPGTWSVTAEQKDAAGNTGTSAARSFGINATLLAAGDIAGCSTTGDEATANLLDSQGGDVVAALGDVVYESGTAQEFADCYDPSWGRAKARTRPAIGNHEYGTPGGAGYFGYFGAAAGNPGEGYYSYDLGAWHVIVLNTNCGDVACAAGSAQSNWLIADLAAHSNRCTMAYWHQPIFTSTTSTLPTDTAVQNLWTILDNAGAELVLNGHAHNYERYAPQHVDGTAAANGIREIIAGTGGRSHHNLSGTAPNREVADNTTFGVLKLTLRQGGYDWQFVPVANSPGNFTDSGTSSCG